MYKNLLIYILLILLFLHSTSKIVAVELEEDVSAAEQIETRKLDIKAKILADYLAQHDSPLQYHAQDFIDAAGEYNLDWKLVAAISGVESTFGKFIPGGYNAWGWGAYDAYHAIYFSSWREAIFTVSQGLRENYINKGYTEPYAMNRIYAASPYWGSKVTFFIEDIEKFAHEYEARVENIEMDATTQTAVISGQLALK